MKNKKHNFSSIKPVLSQEKFHFTWILAASALIMWSLLEELVLSSSDLITNFFADGIKHGENFQLYNEINHFNNCIKSWGSSSPYANYKYSVGSIDVNALAAASQFFVIISSTMFGFCYGVGVYTAQYFGAKKFQHLRDLVMLKILITILIGLISILFIELFSRQLIGFIIHYKYMKDPGSSASPEEQINYFDSRTAFFSIQQGSSYLKIVCISYPILGLQLALVTTLRETGRPILSFWASLITFILTIFFLMFLVEPEFIKSFKGFGLLGCAYAVILGKIFQMILLILFIFYKKYEFIPNRFFRLNKNIIWLSFKKSSIIMINEIFWSFSMLMQVKLLSIYSLDSLTANAILSTFISILLVPTYHGISSGIAVLVGNNLGDNKLKIAEINSKRLIWLTLFLGIFIGLILLSFGLLVSYIFVNISVNVAKLARSFILIFAIATPFLMINGTIYSIIRSGGLVFVAFIIDSLYNWTVTIPAMAILILLTPLNIITIFILVRVFESAKFIPSIISYSRKKWIKNLVYKL